MSGKSVELGSELICPPLSGALLEQLTGSGPLVSFARSNLRSHWGSAFNSLLERAEACDVPVRWSCRSGVCHSCETGLILGAVGYRPDPVDPPADGNVLICCSKPTGDDL